LRWAGKRKKQRHE